MKTRLRLLKPETATGRFGDERVDYTLTRTAHAERVKLSPGAVRGLGELVSGYTAEFNIRDAHAVDEGWRVEEPGGHLYRVAAVVPNHDRGMLTLRCERINL